MQLKKQSLLYCNANAGMLQVCKKKANTCTIWNVIVTVESVDFQTSEFLHVHLNTSIMCV